MKLLAAQGLLPFPPAEQAYVLFRLTSDDEERIREIAVDTLENLPKRIILAACDGIDDPDVLQFLSQKFHNETDVIEKLLLHDNLADDALCFLAEFSQDVTILRIIGGRQDWIARSKRIYDSLKRNPLTPQWLLLQIEGEVLEEEPPKAPSPSPSPLPQAGEGDGTPGEGEHSREFDPLLLSKDIEENGLPAVRGLLRAMDAPARQRLARSAGPQVRHILAQDPSQDVSLEVLSNPEVTLEEIVGYCGLRNVSQEFLRRVGIHKEWSREARIRNLLVKNPKTPHFLVLRFLEGIASFTELERLAKSKDVSGAVSSAAHAILQKRAFRRIATPR